MQLPNLSTLFRTAPASDIMGKAVSTPAPATRDNVQGQPGNGQRVDPGTGMPMDQGNPGADPANQNLDANGNELGDPNKKSSPLDPFSDFFKIDDKDQPPADPFSTKLIDMDAKKLGEAVSKLNFTQGINKQLMQKALGGDVDSMSAILNNVARATFAGAANMVTQMMEAAISKNNGRIESVFGDRIKTHMLNFQRPENSALTHPAAQPVLAALRTTISQSAAGRNLGPEEIAKKAEEYFLSMADAVSAAKPPADNKGRDGSGQGAADQDWTKFLEVG